MLQSVGSQAKQPSIKVITSAHIKDVHTQAEYEALLAEHGSNSKFCDSSFKILRHRGISVPDHHALTDAERASILASMTTEPMAGHGWAHLQWSRPYHTIGPSFWPKKRR